MLKVDKSQEPDLLVQAKRKVANPKDSKAWQSDEIRNISPVLRQHILDEQGGMCAYCEQVITLEKSHIDHFRTRHCFPELTLEYANLWVSCGSDKHPKQHCAHHKDCQGFTKADFLALPEFFSLDLTRVEFTETGRLVAKDIKDTVITRLIEEVLNLNDRALVEDRKRILQQKATYSDFGVDEIFGFFKAHRSLIQQYFR